MRPDETLRQFADRVYFEGGEPKEYPLWLREAASKGGKTSKRKLTKREARRIAAIRWGKKK